LFNRLLKSCIRFQSTEGDKGLDCHWFNETVRNVVPTFSFPKPERNIRHKACMCYDDSVEESKAQVKIKKELL